MKTFTRVVMLVLVFVLIFAVASPAFAGGGRPHGKPVKPVCGPVWAKCRLCNPFIERCEPLPGRLWGPWLPVRPIF